MNSAAEDTGDLPDETAVAAARQAALARGLRVYFRRHNIQAFTLAMLSLLTAVLLWAAIYGFVYWFSLVGATLARSFNPATLLQIERPDLVGPAFGWYFAGGALLSVGVAWAVRQRWRPEQLRERRFYLLWILTELLLAVPNATLAVWGNLSALTRLRRRDAAAAVRLLERVEETDGGINLSALRVEIEDEKTLQRVLFALQLVGLLGVRKKERGFFLCLEKREALALLSRPVEARL